MFGLDAEVGLDCRVWLLANSQDGHCVRLLQDVIWSLLLCMESVVKFELKLFQNVRRDWESLGTLSH